MTIEQEGELGRDGRRRRDPHGSSPHAAYATGARRCAPSHFGSPDRGGLSVSRRFIRYYLLYNKIRIPTGIGWGYSRSYQHQVGSYRKRRVVGRVFCGSIHWPAERAVFHGNSEWKQIPLYWKVSKVKRLPIEPIGQQTTFIVLHGKHTFCKPILLDWMSAKHHIYKTISIQPIMHRLHTNNAIKKLDCGSQGFIWIIHAYNMNTLYRVYIMVYFCDCFSYV